MSEDIGNGMAALEAGPEQIDRQHALVGKPAQVSEYATDRLRDLRDQAVSVTGVIVKLGQVVGYEIKHRKHVYHVPKIAVYVETRVLEDVGVSSAQTVHVREVLSHWAQSRDYPELAEKGIEWLCFELAKLNAPVEVVARAGGWRFVLPDSGMSTVIDCGLFPHDGLRNLGIVVYSSRERLEEGHRVEGIEDFWQRTLRLVITVISRLATTEPAYEAIWERYKGRWRATRELQRRSARLVSATVTAARRVLGPAPNGGLSTVSVGFSDCRLEPAHVGRLEAPSDVVASALISVHPKAVADMAYAEAIVTHELIHWIQTAYRVDESEHGRVFNKLAGRLGLAPRYRD